MGLHHHVSGDWCSLREVLVDQCACLELPFCVCVRARVDSHVCRAVHVRALRSDCWWCRSESLAGEPTMHCLAVYLQFARRGSTESVGTVPGAVTVRSACIACTASGRRHAAAQRRSSTSARRAQIDVTADRQKKEENKNWSCSAKQIIRLTFRGQEPLLIILSNMCTYNHVSISIDASAIADHSTRAISVSRLEIAVSASFSIVLAAPRQVSSS